MDYKYSYSVVSRVVYNVIQEVLEDIIDSEEIDLAAETSLSELSLSDINLDAVHTELCKRLGDFELTIDDMTDIKLLGEFCQLVYEKFSIPETMVNNKLVKLENGCWIHIGDITSISVRKRGQLTTDVPVFPAALIVTAETTYYLDTETDEDAQKLAHHYAELYNSL